MSVNAENKIVREQLEFTTNACWAYCLGGIVPYEMFSFRQASDEIQEIFIMKLGNI